MVTVTYNYLGSVVSKTFDNLEKWNAYYDELNPLDNPYILEVLNIE